MEQKNDPLKGYRGRARQRLEDWGMRVWGDARIVNDAGSVFEGVILPRARPIDDLHWSSSCKRLQRRDHVDRIRDRRGRLQGGRLQDPGAGVSRATRPARSHAAGTGGTIASRLDYRTGAVIPAFTPGELYGAVPELADLCNLTTRKLFGVFSENMGWQQYVQLAEASAKRSLRASTGSSSATVPTPWATPQRC